MPASLEAIEAAALQLPREDRERLIGALLESLEPGPVETPASVAKAWDVEIARRVDELDAGLVDGIPYAQVMAEMREMIRSHRKE